MVNLDENTQLIGQEDPVRKWAFTSGESKNILLSVSKNIKSVLIKAVCNIDSGATAPGISAESPFDIFKVLNIQAGKTKILYEDWVLKALHQAREQQNPMIEDTPTVATSQTNDVFGFEILLPCPVIASEDNEQEIQISIVMATASQMDKSGAGNYSNFDGTLYFMFIPAGDTPVSELSSYVDSDSGSGNLKVRFNSNAEVAFMVISNEVETPSTPSAGAQEVKYEETFTDISFKIADGLFQFTEIELIRQLIAFSEARNDVAGQTGIFPFLPKNSIGIGANNRFTVKSDGTNSRIRMWSLVNA